MQSAFAKLGRAKVHFDQLDADVKAYRARDPHEWRHATADHVFDPSLFVVKFSVKIKEQPPSENWGLIVGDILTNLRAALDHAVVGHPSGRQPLTPAEERKLNYPVLLDRDQWLGAPAVPATATTPAKAKVDSAYKKLKNYIDPAVLAEIEKTQPYNAIQGPAEWHSLALLNDLVNHDKHREVRVITHVREEFTIKHSSLEIVNVDAPPKAMTDGAEVATVTVRRPMRKGKGPARTHLANFRIVNGYIENIDLPKVAARRPVLVVMETLIRDVETMLNMLKAAGC